MPINRAAWLIAKQAYPLEIREAAYTEPGDDEVLLKVHYVALNPGEAPISFCLVYVDNA